MGLENLDRIFDPRRIAVIGASDREGSIGSKLLQNLVGVGYKGAVYPVNPFAPTIQGITAYPSIQRIPWKVDLAIIATPAHTVPQIVEECGKAGVLGLIIISAGFRETGEEGKAYEEQIVDLREQYGMRVIGPNCLGIIRPKVKLNATFADKVASTGKIAFISQSAALCSSVLDWASEAHVGFSAIVSVGSMLDVDFGDLIDYFGMDPLTKSIVLYIESVKNARKFMSAARSFARAKPIIVVKAGKFHESAEAAMCHTGALCGEDAVYDAAFRRAGIVRATGISDLFNCAETLAMQPSPKGSRLTIITNAGGPGVMATDSLISTGGKLAVLDDGTRAKLGKVLPPYCSQLNPIDILEDATTSRFKEVMEICFKDPNSDGYLIIYTPQIASDPVDTARTIVKVSEGTSKPVITAFMGEDRCWRARQILRKQRIPAFSTAEDAVATFMHMCNYAQNLELLYETPEELPIEVTIPVFLREVLLKAFNEGRTVLTEPESKQFLDAYGIPALTSPIATTSEEAIELSSKIGYPIVMKAVSPQITHKTRVDGVVLDIRNEEEAGRFFNKLKRRVEKIKPRATFDGVIVQPMVQKKGYEILIGAKRDAQFGSVILFGMGGVTAELLKDVSIGFPPLNQVLATRLMEKTDIYSLFSGSGNQRVNLKELKEILVKFSQLVIDFPEIKEMDINPLIVDENNAVAVDARIVLDSERVSRSIHPHEHLVITPYPRRYVTEWTMKNGTHLVLRPIKPEDENRLYDLFKSFSEKTMRFRFFQIIREMSHATLTRYCNIDYNREIAIVGEASINTDKKILGVARLIVQPGRKHGEFAVAVGDQWQGLGLGSKLVDRIIEIGHDLGLEQIYGDVLSENRKMFQLCEKKGFQMNQVDEETTKATLTL